jgi:hypothetical protein
VTSLTKSRSSNVSWLKTTVAALGAASLAGVCVVAPLSASTEASAEVVPLAQGEVMNQKLMAEATAESDFTLPSVSVSEIPKKKEEPKKDDEDQADEEEPEDDGDSSAPATGTPDPGSAQEAAQKYVGSGKEFDCLVALWDRESSWNVYAQNAGSGAYGIPQALPGNKMADAGSDWKTNADTQIRWGLGYIKDRYGSPCAAWGHSNANGWY